MKYNFITFEGGEGSGKGTQISKIKLFLESKGHNVVLTKEPGGTIIGSEIRKILLNPKHSELCFESELLLYFADRIQHLNTVIRPFLRQGKIILCDRYLDSTIAYQHYGRMLNRDMINSLSKFLDILMPDITFYFDIPAEAGLKRARFNEFGAADRLESEEIAFHERLRKGYLEIAKNNPERIKVIDASQSIDEISSCIINYLE